MAKEIKAKVKLQVPGGGATPARPVATLGQHGANIMEFCKQFNAKTADRKGQTVPVVVTIFVDKTFQFVIKTAPVTELLKKRAKVEKGSPRPHEQKVGSVTWRDIEEIAREKMPDLNAHDIEQAKKIIAGSARSMGINIID